MSRDQDNICNINLYAQRPYLERKKNAECPGWEESWDGGDDDEEEMEDPDADFELGADSVCGEIEHFGELCVDMDETAAKNAVLTSMCDREFCLTSNGYIRDKASDLCLTVSDPNQNDGYVSFGACNSAEQWEISEQDGIRIKDSSDKCWHPLGGLNNPSEDTQVVIYDGCNEDRLVFDFQEAMCWEEVSNSKLNQKLRSSSG